MKDEGVRPRSAHEVLMLHSRLRKHSVPVVTLCGARVNVGAYGGRRTAPQKLAASGVIPARRSPFTACRKSVAGYEEMSGVLGVDLPVAADRRRGVGRAEGELLEETL